MAENRYKASCSVCGSMVPANGGTLTKKGRNWDVRHLACDKGQSSVVSFYFEGSGKTMTRNAKGMCIDAPCCGCCTV